MNLTAREQRRRRLMAEAKNPEYALNKKGKRFCRWCGKRLVGRRTSFCSGGKVTFRFHPPTGVRRAYLMETWGCVEEWRMRTDGKFMRHAVEARDNRVCAQCGQGGHEWQGNAWEADHIEPIWRGGTGGLDNLQTLCGPCHRVKSGKENAQRLSGLMKTR